MAVLALAACWWPAVVDAQDEARQLRIEYVPPQLTVEAQNTPLVEVLTAIGAQLGFTVAGARVPSAPVTIAIAGSPPDQVLRRLLRAENHTIVYRRGEGSTEVIDRVVLLGGPSPAGAPDIGSPAAAVPVTPERSSEAPVASSPAPEGSGPPTGPAVPASASAGDAPTATAEHGDQPTVGDILRAHALTAAPLVGAETQGGVATPMPAPAPETSPTLSLDESLVIATRRAQEGLAALVEGLQAVTRSLQQSAPASQ